MRIAEGVKGVAHKSSAATAGVSSLTDLIIKMRLPLVLRQHHSMNMQAEGSHDQRHLYDMASVNEYTASPRTGRLCHAQNEERQPCGAECLPGTACTATRGRARDDAICC
jgi:hypothetical protein